MNAGGIRADLTFPSSPAGEGDGVVTYGEAFSVQPFGNSLVTMTLTGAQIEHCSSASSHPAGNGILQVSAGLTYDRSTPCPRRQVSNIRINGVLVDPVGATGSRSTASWLTAVTTTRSCGTARTGCGNVDTDAFENYLTANPAVAPGPQNRITRIP